MDGVEPPHVYFFSAILYLLPIGFLLAAWMSVVSNIANVEISKWRRNCLLGALILATIGTVAALGFDYSWLRCGGRIHGLPPSPGFWQTIRPIFLYSFVAAVVLAIVGKGKGRFKLLGWGAAMVFVNFAVGLIAMD